MQIVVLRCCRSVEHGTSAPGISECSNNFNDVQFSTVNFEIRILLFTSVMLQFNFGNVVVLNIEEGNLNLLKA